ncbi:MAG: Gfo/Idh/MocA family oxidoreductase [Armatimonadetes bacterium]|nr:Gfo/Idh/MocA family oxidoreductase [Armatimonadota bacterium]
MDSPVRLKAAVVGASGIGKHHAKWLHALGCDVCAIVGTSVATVDRASRALRDIFPFAGRGYLSIEEMLAAEDPDLVHVCTPPHLHYEHVLALAAHRCHVLCEKPLTWDEQKPSDRLLAEAAELTAAVAQPGRVSAVNLQYTAVPAAYQAHAARAGWPLEPPRSFFMHMDSRRADNVYEIIWRELAPHALSVMQAFCGAGEVDNSDVDMTIGERLCRACFTFRPPWGPDCSCEIVVGSVPEGPLVRRFGINGRLVDYEGRNDASGTFRAYLRSGELETESDDFMLISMRQMILSCRGEADRPLATLAEGLRNQEMQLRLIEHARHGNSSQ